MATKPKPQPSPWLTEAKKKHGRTVAKRLKGITKAKQKRQGSRGGGYSRGDLEALRDGRT